MSKLTWYWRRLRAMSSEEWALHARKKWRQAVDAKWRLDGRPVSFEEPGVYPSLPEPAKAPETLRAGVVEEAKRIRAGEWLAFGHVPLQVDNPPRWHKDYLSGVELATRTSGFQLDHRELRGGADIKLIWELSRWHALTRLAMASWLLKDREAARQCLSWLQDWVAVNRPFRGWNWTSALETGIRLIQFVWMDALMSESMESMGERQAWRGLRREVLPAHTHYTWRHRSFGSSANNHLLGELAGLIAAVARWPQLARWCAPLEVLQSYWEREVAAQFAEDGGNREQALSYQLFSWELCWHARCALRAAGRTVGHEAEERLSRAADFFSAVQIGSGSWQYGDSDNAFVLPLTSRMDRVVKEWHAWVNHPGGMTALSYWLGEAPQPDREPACVWGAGDWLVYPQSGQAVCWTGEWQLRWDLSPLGFLSTAAHGHLDALHLSIWLAGVPMVIDPGTGSYYADKRVRNHLAGWSAHNGPHVPGMEYPRRFGTFLWGEQPPAPSWSVDTDRSMAAVMGLPGGRVKRVVRRMEGEDGWQVDDDLESDLGRPERRFQVRWQFPPGSRLEKLDARIFRVEHRGIGMRIGVDSAWQGVEMRRAPLEEPVHPLPAEAALDGICSPAFRRTAWGPQLALTAPGHNPCLFRTTFLASPAS